MGQASRERDGLKGTGIYTGRYQGTTKNENEGELGGKAPLFINSPPIRAGIEGWVAVREPASVLLTCLDAVTLDSRQRGNDRLFSEE